MDIINAGLLLAVCVVPGLAAGAGVLIVSRRVANAVARLLAAVLASHAVAAVPFAVFFAHDAPNDFTTPTFYVVTLGRVPFVLFWLVVWTVVLVVLRLRQATR